jgi:hypothetical protein
MSATRTPARSWSWSTRARAGSSAASSALRPVVLLGYDPLTGQLHERGRLTGALGEYYASPVASGGRLYLASLAGDVVVVTADPQWEVEAIGSLDEPIFATPALAEERLYLRTPTTLYCFSGRPIAADAGR